VSCLIIAGAVACGAVLPAVLEIRLAVKHTGVNDVEREIARALPAGSSEADIVRYLDSTGLPHYLFTSDDDSNLREHNVPRGAHILGSHIDQDDSLVWYSEGQILIRFVLSDDRRLERVIVYERSYGPFD